MSEYIISDELDVLRQWIPKLTEIVRCRDCEKRRDWTEEEESASYGEAELADGWCMFLRIGTYDDFFCAWGERRGE